MNFGRFEPFNLHFLYVKYRNVSSNPNRFEPVMICAKLSCIAILDTSFLDRFDWVFLDVKIGDKVSSLRDNHKSACHISNL